MAHTGGEGGGVAGMQMAAEELSAGKGLLGRKVKVTQIGPGGPSLAGLTDDPGVLGAVVFGPTAASIKEAAYALDVSGFPVFVTADLYDAGELQTPVFQLTAPHSWQAFRLARYFGPGDRGYSKVAILREPGPAGEVAGRALSQAADLRSLEFIDVAAGVEDGISQLADNRPEVVVLEGSPGYLQQALTKFANESLRYQGRRKIHTGWRPQIAGFESLLDLAPTVPGTVAASDYARPQAAQSVDFPPVSEFRNIFRKKFDREPTAADADGYDLVMLLAKALRRTAPEGTSPAAALDRPRFLEELANLDRVRFAHLPISLGPFDHIIAERDFQGLWATTNNGNGNWAHLMRTFTSDLERTNIFEDDWPVFFEGTTPGGEAPFYHQAKSGITTDKEDDLN